MWRALIDIGLVATRRAQRLHIGLRVLRGFSAARADDVDQRALDVLGHALGVAAHIEMRAALEPCEEFRTLLAHSVLHVDFLVAVARPGERQAGESASALQALQLLPIEEVAGAVLM